MTPLQQSMPLPGTAENAVAGRFWRQTAWIAGVFLLLVGIGMVVAQLRHKSSDPWRSPVLLELKAQLLTAPGDEGLKQQIRELDLRLRERYFQLLSLKATGVYLLLGGALVFLYAGNRVRLLNERPPLPQPDPEAAIRLTRQAGLARNAIAACGVLALAAFVLLGFTRTPSPLSDPERMAAVLGQDRPAPAPSYTVPAEELRANWPRFRGHDGSGVALAGPPLDVAPGVVWQVDSPAPGFNSPLVWKNNVFLTGGDEAMREVVSLSALTGEVQWRQRVRAPATGAAEDTPEIPEMTGYAAPTAATDGERVYALFASGELAAFTLDGWPLWTRHMGILDNPYGHATSLATWEDQVIVQLDQGDDESRQSKIVVFDGRTGEMTWQKARPVGASWSTPIVIHPADQPQVITLGLPWTIAYSPAEGVELWRARWLEGEITPSPVFVMDRLILVDPGMYQLLAVRPDGRGDVTETHQVWRVDGAMPDITSPVSDGERVYTLTTDGKLSCFDVQSGGKVWEQSFDVRGEFQASPSIAGNTLLLVSTAGLLIGVETGPDFHELWRTPLADEFHASPAFANEQVYLRGHHKIWCLGAASLTISQE